jgi:hypothetical protein
MSGRFRLILVVLAHVFDGVCRADDLRGPFLSFGGPHGDAGEKAAVRDFELREGVGDIASIVIWISDHVKIEYACLCQM